MKYIKKPIQTSVEFAREAGVIQTLEGLVAYTLGDALMTGVAGERWPIRRTRFEVTYAPVFPTVMGEDGTYLKKPMPVTARQATKEETIALLEGQGTLKAMVGDWIVTSGDGHEWVVANDVFLASYQTAE